MAICIAKRKPRVEYSQISNPRLYMIIHYCIVTVPKTENSIRTIALPENTVTLLTEEHSKHPDSALMFWCPRINGYWSPDSLHHLHKQMLTAAGVVKVFAFMI